MPFDRFSEPIEAFVWSRGLEKWEPCVLTFSELASFVYLYDKAWDGKKYVISLDNLGRFIAYEFGSF